MSDSLDKLSRTHDPSPSRTGSRRRLPAWLLPALVLLGFALLFAVLFRDRLLPAQEVRAARVVALEPNERSAQDEKPEGGDDSEPDAAPPDGPVLFQASGWIEPDPYPVKATALVEGVVDEVHVLEGALVEKGDPLATLIAEDFELRLEAARAELQRRITAREAGLAAIEGAGEQLRALRAEITAAEAARDAAKDRFDRFRNIGERGVAKGDIADARFALARAEARVAGSEARVRETEARRKELEHEAESLRHEIAAARTGVAEAELALERTTVRAPVSGRIQRLHVAPGKKRMLATEDPDSATIAELYDPESLQARVDVPLADAAGLRAGQHALVRCNLLPDRTFRGRVTRLVGQADISRNTLQAKVALDDPADALRPEMICRVEFLGGDTRSSGQTDRSTRDARSLALWVPEDAVADGRVWVIDADTGRVEPREPELGRETREGHRRVRDGLRAGEAVVLNPDNLGAGDRVHPTFQP